MGAKIVLIIIAILLFIGILVSAYFLFIKDNSPPLIGGCGGVAPWYTDECCEREFSEGNADKTDCEGYWIIDEGECKFECGYKSFEFLGFSLEECETSNYDEELGIVGIEAIDNILEIKANVSINCAESVTRGDYNLEEGKIILNYYHTKCQECTTCKCITELTYKFKGIDENDYEFELKENILE